MEIERTHDTVCRQLLSQETTMPKGKRLCSISRAIINNVFDYGVRLKKRDGGRIQFDFVVLCHGMKEFANNAYVGITKSAVNRFGKRSSAGSSGVSSHVRVQTTERPYSRRYTCTSE